MPYVLSIERIAERRGRQEGRLEGRRDGLVLMLEIVHGEAGQRLGQRLATVNDEAVLTRLEAHLRARAPLATLEAEIDAAGQAGS